MGPLSVPFRGISGLLPLLLLISACGEGPTSPRVNAAPDVLLSSHASAGGETSAAAEFYAVEECRETEARIVASETGGRDGTATLELTYSVLGVCGDGEGLFYYDLSTQGVVPIPPSELFTNPGLQRASLDTEVTVFDEEAGAFGTIRVRPTWERSRGGRDQPVIATLEVSGSFLSQQYLTNPMTSFEAELTRSRP